MTSPAFLGTLGRYPTDILRATRARVSDILEYRERQTSLFEAPPAVVMLPAAAPPSFVADVPDVLSPSSVNCYQSCSAKWYYRKVLRLPESRTAALGLGSAVHVAVAENFRQKIDTLRDLALDAVRAIFRGALRDELDTVRLEAGESAADLISCGETLLKVYMEQAAPSIQPAAVELPVEGLIGETRVHGFIDILDVNGDVIDLKTSSKKPSCISADHRLQITTYAMLAPGASGRGRRDVVTKTKTVAHSCQTFDVSAADRKYAERLYSITLDQMRTGLVAPNRSSFLCSRRCCSFWAQCEADFGGIVD